ncbi:MAG: c-type cytochrome, partial [Gammaproteobacteria bacterium]|nr:c-type cytochrome [Gammaproteobacteria bacterium]
DEIDGCGANQNHREIDATVLQVTAMFLNNIDPPAPVACASLAGAQVFNSTGCTSCHTPSLPGPGARGAVRLYSDLLLHDMGTGLADQMQQGSAKGHEWRTMPLWSLKERSKFLHDGRATTVTDAISAHGGQAQGARDVFQGLSDADKATMLEFLQWI